MSVEDNKLVVREFVEETLNKGNVDAAGDYVADSVIELVPFPGQGPGLAGLKETFFEDANCLPGYALDDRGANCRSGQGAYRLYLDGDPQSRVSWCSRHGTPSVGLGDGDRSSGEWEDQGDANFDGHPRAHAAVGRVTFVWCGLRPDPFVLLISDIPQRGSRGEPV
jgi:hypothetical protein